MQLNFKKFTVSNNKLSYILKFKTKKDQRSYYYTDIEDLFESIPSKFILKSEAKDIKSLLDEINDLKKELKKIKVT